MLAGAVAEFGEGCPGPVVKLGAGERGDQSRLPGAGSRLRAEGRRLADAGVVEAVTPPGQRSEADLGDNGERRPFGAGRPPADAVANGGLGHRGGTPCMHRSKGLVDRVGNSLRTGAGFRCGGVRTPVLARIAVPERVVAHFKLDVNKVLGFEGRVDPVVFGTITCGAGINLEIEAKSVMLAWTGLDQITVRVGGTEDGWRAWVGERKYTVGRIE